ncbi:MAG: M50 family metallopeptidase [Candidatus Promineifilaceae bacterium]
MPSIFSLFNILSLLYIFRSAQLSIAIWREWSNLTNEPLTPHKKSLANQASFFIAVPIAVFVHEASHALAILATGGEVVQFNYRVFWGYVVPGGSFSASEMWLIAIAGTVGSLLTGVLMWLVTRNAQSSFIRYFGLRAIRFQIYFSLIYYPIFTLLGFDGDWRTIYDFSKTPILSGSTLVFHAVILFLFWRFDRQGWFEAPAFANVSGQQQFEQLAATAMDKPENVALQMEVIDTLRRGGATNKARYQLDKLIEQNPESGLAQLELASLQSMGKDTVSKDAGESAQKALSLGLTTPAQKAYAHELIGRYQMDRGLLQEAGTNFSEGIEILGSGSSPVIMELHILRNQVYRRQQNYNAAYQDLMQAMAIAQQSGNESAIKQINSELDILAKHSGQVYSTISTEN